MKNKEEVKDYIEKTLRKSDLARTDLSHEKTGIKLEGVFAVNPLTNEEIPIFIADYVLPGYATGAIMAVPAHDERDKEFAKKFNINIKPVIDEEKNTIINSDILNGSSLKEGKEKAIVYIEEKGFGRRKVNYKLRDWVFSRQRYWGEPIPVIICPKCGYVPLKEEELPLKLPEIESYEPGPNGESPLEGISDWVNVKCPKCFGDAKRETDTMPQWAGSSWYYLRYLEPNNSKELASEEMINYWLPVDWYNGGMEHTTLHLLYSRFWHKFLYDIGIVNTPEPYAKRTTHGVILGENNEKMSKSRGNVVNPDDVVKEYGADTLRLYEMFVGDFEKAAPWNTSSIKGCRRFIERYWGLQNILKENSDDESLKSEFNETIRKITDDVLNLKFNTAIASLMSLINLIYNRNFITKKELKLFSILLNPFAPHVTEEVWEKQKLGKDLLCRETWPKHKENIGGKKKVNIVVQINGKLRDTFTCESGFSEEGALNTALDLPKIKKFLEGKKVLKHIYVKDKILNLVTKG